MPGHRPRVAEAEVDVLDPVDIDEASTLSLRDVDREAAGPLAHPVHRHALEERPPRALPKLPRARMALDETCLLPGLPLGERRPSSGATDVEYARAPRAARRLDRDDVADC